MHPSLGDVFRSLVSEGLLASEDDKALREGAEKTRFAGGVPWYVRVLVAAGAWIAALLFILFVFLAEIVRQPGPMIAFGAVFLAIAVLLRRTVAAEFATQFSLALSFAAQAVLCAGIFLSSGRDTAAAAALLAVSVALIALFPDAVHRFLSTLVAAGALAWLLAKMDSSYATEIAIAVVALAALAVWEAPERLGGIWAEVRSPLGHGLVAAVLVANVQDIVGHHRNAAWMSSIGISAAGLFLVVRVLRAQGLVRSRAGILATGATCALAALTASMPSGQAALFAMLLGFQRRRAAVLGMGVLLFAAVLSRYYYDLELTLLEKSAVLVISGALLLLARRFLLSRPAAVPGVAP